jgi:hypothetical protein
VTVLLVALWIAESDSLTWLWEEGSILTLLTLLVGSGAVGLFLSQLYFSLPLSFPDYRRLLATLNDSLPCEIKQAERIKAFSDKRAARLLVTYLWHTDAIACDRNNKKWDELNTTIRNYAIRKAAIGATASGILLGAFVFMWRVAKASPSPIRLLLAVAILLLSFLLLCSAHRRINRELGQLVTWGLKRRIVQKNKGGDEAE